MGTPETSFMVWFAREQYEKTLQVMEDGMQLPARYDWWEEGAQEQLDRISSWGARPVLVLIDPQEFQDWCAKEGVPANAETRIEYAALLAGAF